MAGNDLVTIQITGDRELMVRMKDMPLAVMQALKIKVQSLSLMLEGYIKTQKLNGQVLNRITGALSRSIFQKVVASVGSVMGFVFSSGDVKYAAIHEYGGTIQSPGGTAYMMKEDGMAQFVSNAAATADMPRTQPHTIHMPERSYMRSSLRDKQNEITLGMKTAVVQAIQKQVKG